MERLENFIRNISKTFEWVGVMCYLVMLLVNIIDVVGAKFFNWPFPGSIEIVSFSQIVAIALTIPIGLFIGFHLSIDFIIEKFPKTLKYLIDIFVSIVCVLFFILVFCQTLEFGYTLQESGEIGSVSKIPLFPFAYIIAIGIVPVILFYIFRSMKLLRKGR